jgi:hypothetical protein
MPMPLLSSSRSWTAAPPRRRALVAGLGLALLALGAPIASAGTLVAVTPAGASVGVTIAVTGSGFDAVAANNRVVFTPAGGDPPVTAVGTTISAADSAGQRRLTVVVPAGVPAGPAALRVVNTISGETSDGRSLDVITLTLPEVAAGAPGTTGLPVHIAGSALASFVVGTRAALGAGITVTGTRIDSAHDLVVTVTIAATAALGPRDVNVTTSTQTVRLGGGFTVQAPGTNHAPTVSAGTNQTITLPAGASLNGSVTDDGLPTGALVTRAWSKFSGPGNVTFANAASTVTTATFDQAGSYVLRLTASDTLLSAFSDVAITVNPAVVTPPTNLAPVVSAGPSQTIALPAGASLSGSVTDDGLPTGATVTSAWTKFSGPGNVTFANAASTVTTATFDQAGSYVLRLTASDTLLSAFSDVTITVNPAVTPTNLAPVVSAGTNQTITLPAGASLSGSVTDDGLPTGSTVTSAWTKFSGPGTVTFSNAGSAVTTATFDQAGSYVLRLTASDSLLSKSADVTITVGQADATIHVNGYTGTYDGKAHTASGSAAGVNGEDLTALLHLGGSFTDVPGGSASWTFDGNTIYKPASGSAAVSITQANATIQVAGFNGVFDGAAHGATGSAAGVNGENLSALLHFGSSFTDAPGGVAQWTFDGTSNYKSATGSVTIVISAVAQTEATIQVTGFTGVYDGNAHGATGSATGANGENLVSLLHLGASFTSVPGGTAHWTFDGNSTYPAKSGDATIAIAPADATIHVTGFAGVDDGQPHGASGTATGVKGEDLAGLLTLGSSFTSPPGGTAHWTFAGNTNYKAASGDVAITLGPASNRLPPVITLTAPKEALPGSQFTVTADASDTVTSVQFQVDQADPAVAAGPPYQRVITVADVASPGTLITVRATGLDAVGNTGTASAQIKIVAQPDTTKPTVSLKLPPQAAPGSSIVITAIAADNVGVDAVGFSVNGTPFASVSHAPYQVTYVVPADTAAESVLTLSALAADAAGNRAQADGVVAIVATPNTTPPTVTIAAPPTVLPSSTVQVTADATAANGIASVAFFVDGALAGTAFDAPYSATIPVPAGAAPGSIMHVEARASDRLGLQSSAAANMGVVAAGTGVLTGTVYDDAIGLPVIGAAVTLNGRDSRGVAYTQSTTSDGRGRYVIHATEGQGTLQIAKPGWTRLDRPVTIQPNKAIQPVDARLRSAGAASPAIPAVSGGTITAPALAYLDVWRREITPSTDPSLGNTALGGPDVEVRVPAGALSVDAALSLTPVSRQGLAGLLPVGWTPIAAIDVTPHGTAFTGPVDVKVPNPLTLAAGTLLTVARWDESVSRWRALSTSAVPQNAVALETTIDSTAQYAWLLADTLPVAPPQPADGSLVDGVAATLIPADASAVVDPQPKILFYKPGVTSDVRARVTTTAPLSSGTLARTRILESYQFFSGAELRPDQTVEDLVLYQIPGAGALTLVAGFPVAPSLTFEALTLQKGTITVEMRAPGELQQVSAVIGSDGGTVQADSGERLDVSAGALSSPLPIAIQVLSAAEVGVPAPDGFVFIDAVSVSSDSAFASAAALSIARTSQVGDTDIVLVARLQELAGRTRFVVVAAAAITSDRIVSDTTVAGGGATFEGVLVPGRYVFLRATSPLAFAAGTVAGIGGGPFPGAMVAADATSALVALSQPAGRYVAPIALGGAALTAIDPVTGDAGSGQANAGTPRQLVPLDLALNARPPTVTSVTPNSGAQNVSLSTAVVVTFSAPIDPATVTVASVRLASATGSVAGTLEFSSGNRLVTFRSAQPLAPNTAYTLNLATSITDPFGRALPSAFATTFTSLNTIAPPPPPAGTISASIPGADGTTTITVTQGAAGSHDVVLVKNVTRGTLTPISAIDPSVGFSVAVQAAFTDKLQLVIQNASGIQTLVAIPPFRRANADGSVSQAVTAEGGHVDGPAGIGVDVPAGAFPDGVILTLKPVAEADFPIQLTAQQRQFFKFSGGLQIDLGGQIPTVYLNVSLPLSGGETVDDQWIVALASQYAGQPLLQSVDTAHVIDHRIQTSSPPCPGVTGSGVYGFLKADRPMGVVYGRGPVANADALSSAFAQAIVDMQAIALGSVLMPISSPMTIGGAEGDFLAIQNLSKTFCLPLLGSRLSVTPNRVGIAIAAADVKAGDLDLRVHDNTLNTDAHFFAPFATTFSVEGGDTDSFDGVMTDAFPNSRPMALTLAPRTYVAVSVLGTTLQLTDSSITITDVTSKSSWSSGLQASPVRDASGVPTALNAFSDVHAILEGTPSDTFEVAITDQSGVSHSAALAAVAPYVVGHGNLLLRALPGTIDPTHDEIVAFNARVPAGQQIPVNGVTRVEVQGGTVSEVLLDSTSSSGAIVGGGFIHAIQGSLDDQYTLKISYENGTVEDLRFPSFHVTVKTTSGSELKTVTGFVPPRGEPLFIDINVGGPQPQLTVAQSGFSAMDPRAPLTFAFSEPLDPRSVNSHLGVFAVDAHGHLSAVDGSWDVSDDGRSVTFTPSRTLAFGADYRVAFNGVITKSGLPLPVSSIPVRTFQPRKIGMAALALPHNTVGVVNAPSVSGALPINDFNLMRRLPSATGSDTFVIAASGNQTGFKFHDLDVTPARAPTEPGHTAGGQPRRLTRISNGASHTVDVEYDVPLIPQAQSMSCWAASAAMIVAWREQLSFVDQRQIASRAGFWTNFKTNLGLPPDDAPDFLNFWHLVPEPPQSRSVQQMQQLLETFGPLWVGTAEIGAHIRVVTGLVGDGTPNGTFVIINDPWEAGMDNFRLPNAGSVTRESYSVFVARQEQYAHRLFMDTAGLNDLCINGDNNACVAVQDPTISAALDLCAQGNPTACNALAATGKFFHDTSILMAHADQMPANVPPPVQHQPLTLQGGTGLTAGDTQPDTNRIFGLLQGCDHHVTASPINGKPLFAGDLLVASLRSSQGSSIGFYDVTDLANPCQIGDKPLTRDPESVPPPLSGDYSAKGTVKGAGFAGGVAVLQTTTGYAAYVAVSEIGLMAVDVGKNIPAQYAFFRQQEGLYPGDYVDVVAVGDQLLALNNNDGGDPSLDAFDASLSQLSSLGFQLTLGAPGLGNKVHQLRVIRNVSFDRNQNGTLEPGETADLAFVAGSNGVTIFDVTDLNQMAVLGVVPMPGIQRELAVSGDGKTLLVGGTAGLTIGGRDAFFIVDVSNPTISALVDQDHDGLDDRIVFNAPYADGVGALSIDDDRDLAYVGSDAAVDVWAISRRGSSQFNQAPVADAGPDQAVDKDQSVTLDGTRSSDPDGDPLHYSWTQAAGPSVVLAGNGTPHPTFKAPPTEGETLTFQLAVDDGTATSAAASVTITTNKSAHLTLRPVIAALAIVPGTKQLTVSLDPGNGSAATDVTADPKTTYKWLGTGLVSGAGGVPDVTSILNALSAKLGAPIGLAQIDVSPSGTLTVNAPGLQVVRAHYKDGPTEVDSGFTVVLAGITLKEITLRPESPITTLVGGITESLGSSKNPPLILTTVENGYISKNGIVLLDDVTFEMLGQAKIKLGDLLDAIKPLVNDALTAALAGGTGPAAPLLANAFTKLIGLGLQAAGTQLLDPLESTDTSIATVTQAAPFKGLAEGKSAGLASIKGTLDLADLGKADDSVLAWVLPSTVTAKIEQNVTGIHLSDPPSPGPSVRTFVEVAPIANATIPLTGKAKTTAELLDRFFPDGSASWSTSIDKDFKIDVPAPNLRFHIKGTATSSCTGPDAGGESQCDVAFSNLGLGFYAPNNLRPLITNDYAIGDATIAALGSVDTFDTHIVHQHVAGESPLSAHLTIAGMGSADDTSARIYVGDGPRLTKVLLDCFKKRAGIQPDCEELAPVAQQTNATDVFGQVATVEAGGDVDFRITVSNPFDTPFTNVQVTDNEFFFAQGGASELLLKTEVLQVGTLVKETPYSVDRTVTTPGLAGILRNEVSAPGSPSRSATIPVLLDHLVLSPTVVQVLTVPATAQLTLTLEHTNGFGPEDVTADVETQYFWLGGGLTEGVDGVPVVQAMFDFVNATRRSDGLPPLPVQIAGLTVDNNGVLHATTPGIQIVRATRENVKSNISVVFVSLPAPMINELVVQPQKDWDDSGAGGNGKVFDAAPGSSTAPSPAVTSADQWIEILTNTGTIAELDKWTLEFTDASGALVHLILGPNNLFRTPGSPYIVIGNPGGIGLTSVVKLIDSSGGVVDTVDLAAVHAVIGLNGSGVADESVARSPDGLNSHSVGDFKRKMATLGTKNP